MKGPFPRKLVGRLFLLMILCPGGLSIDAQDLSLRVLYKIPGMDKVEVRRNLTYKKDAGAELKMDVYMPPGLAKDARLPAVIFVHGGYLSRDLALLPKEWGVYVSYGQLMAASGLVGVTFNHRYYGWTEPELAMSFSDVTDAIQYVHKNAASFHVNPDRICLWGFSGGGPHLSIPLRNKMDYIRCIVSFYAILDLSEATQAITPPVPKETVEKYSPVTYLTENNYDIPPMLIVRAGLDSAGINRSVDRFASKAWQLNAPIDVLAHPLGCHGFDILDDDARTREVIAATISFIKTNLNLANYEDVTRQRMAARLQAFLNAEKIESAKRVFHELDQNPAAKPLVARIVSETRLNVFGYALLQESPKTALEVFQWSMELNPDSPEAYNSLADAYEVLKNAELAVTNAERALALLEKAKDLTTDRRKRIRDSATAKLQRLKK